jgi:hypothetical protein
MLTQIIVSAQHAAICQLEPREKIPAWAQNGDFTALVRTPEELSVVCDERCVPAQVKVDTGWRILEIQGPLEFSQVGVLAGIAMPLAQAGVSIFVISTFNTDYILVKDISLEIAILALRDAGYKIEVP